MDKDSIELTPWGEFIANKYLNKQTKESKNTTTMNALLERIRERRKQEIGSDMSLVKLIRENNKPNHEYIAKMGQELTKYSLLFLRDCGIHPDCENHMDFEEFFSDFYRYALYMYSTDSIGDESIDDLILLARTYQRNPETFRVVVENDLPIDLLDEFQDWIGYFGDYPQAPQCFEDIVTAAVATYVGMMNPKN